MSPKKKNIIKFFNETQKDIELFWGTNRNYSIHYGYHDKDHKGHDKALKNMNRTLAGIANITPDDTILDAGCGIGGSAIYIAKNIGSKVTGININKNQIEKAKILAKKNNVQDRTEFYVKDFTDTRLPNNSFDVIWAIESAIFAENKTDFLKESKRILKPDGRMIIADIYEKENITSEQKKVLDKWLNGWTSPPITTLPKFKKDLEKEGFKNIEIKDITKNITPSSRRMYLGSILTYPIYKLLELVNLKTSAQVKNIASAYHQYKALKKGLWKYIIFYAQK